MKMREIINLLEERDPHFGEALWVSPDGRTHQCEGEHPEFLQEFGSLMGLEMWEIYDDDANYYAIKKGWTRVVIFRDGQDTNLASDSEKRARMVFKSLFKEKWSKADAQSSVMVDIYEDDPTTPRTGSYKARDFLTRKND